MKKKCYVCEEADAAWLVELHKIQEDGSTQVQDFEHVCHECARSAGTSLVDIVHVPREVPK